MWPDRANRTVIAMVLLAVAMSAVIALIGLCSYGALTYRLAHYGFNSWTTAGTQAAFLLSVLLTGGLAFGAHTLRRQIVATQRLERRVRRHVVDVHPTALTEAAASVGLDGRIDVIAADEPSAFTMGLLRPRVVVTRALVEKLDEHELEAVLAHERYHVRNFDPLKLLATRVLPSAFFYLPIMKQLLSRYMTTRELAADRRAIEHRGRQPLAGALFNVVSAPAWADLSAAAAIGGDQALDARVTQLEDGQEPRLPHLAWYAVGLSTLGAAGVVWAVAATMSAFGGPAALMRAVCTGS